MQVRQGLIFGVLGVVIIGLVVAVLMLTVFKGDSNREVPVSPTPETTTLAPTSTPTVSVETETSTPLPTTQEQETATPVAQVSPTVPRHLSLLTRGGRPLKSP